jgi:hypothetical protein
MIAFKMNILNFNSNGSYSVEYIPESSECTPIKLTIQLDPKLLSEGTKEMILNRLKSSSPQDYWERELASINSSSCDLASLVNTVHDVSEINSVGNFSGRTTRSQFAGVDLPSSTVNPLIGRSSPEQYANDVAQERVRLKLLIQEVIEEMAEGTV